MSTVTTNINTEPANNRWIIWLVVAIIVIIILILIFHKNDKNYYRTENFTQCQTLKNFYPPGSWALTCQNAEMIGDQFFAECKTKDGSYQVSSVDISKCRGCYVVNNNGLLECSDRSKLPPPPDSKCILPPETHPGGSWVKTCHSPCVSNGVLSAICTKADGFSQEPTSINFRDCPQCQVVNDNGELRCQFSN